MKRAATPEKAKPAAFTVVAGVAIMCLIWGSTWLVIREGLRDLPPFLSAGVRFSVAAGLMVVLAPALAKREGGERPAVWLWVASGLLNFTVTYAVVYWCEQTLPSGLVSLLWAVFPILVAINGHFFLPGERLRGRQWMGFVVGFVGVGLLFRTDLTNLGADAARTGAILMISPIAASAGNTLVKRHGQATSSSLLNRNGMGLAAVLLLALALVAERDMPVDWTPRAVFSVAYLSIAGTVTTFGLYFWLLRFAPAHLLSLVAFVTPAIALFLGWLLADEPVTGFTLLGAVLIVGGIALVIGRRRAESVRA